MVKFDSAGAAGRAQNVHAKNNGAGQSRTQNAAQGETLLSGKAGDQLSLNNDYLGIQRECQKMDGQDESKDSAEDGQDGAARSHGKGKGAGRIPPGIAKKSSADLPDGNPWKAVLAQREANEAQKQADEEQKRADAEAAKQQDTQLMGDLLALMQNMMQTMEQLRKPVDTEKPAETDKPADDTALPTEAAVPVDAPKETEPAQPEASVHEAVTTGPLDDPIKLQQEIQAFNHFDAGNVDALVAFLNVRFPETSFTIQGDDLKYTLNGQDFLIAASGESFPR